MHWCRRVHGPLGRHSENSLGRKAGADFRHPLLIRSALRRSMRPDPGGVESARPARRSGPRHRDPAHGQVRISVTLGTRANLRLRRRLRRPDSFCSVCSKPPGANRQKAWRGKPGRPCTRSWGDAIRSRSGPRNGPRAPIASASQDVLDPPGPIGAGPLRQLPASLPFDPAQ
jgi:hypothetical protein